MAKIGTAHIEIKPVISDEVLDVIAAKIEAAVTAGFVAGMKAAGQRPVVGDVRISGNPEALRRAMDRARDRAERDD